MYGILVVLAFASSHAMMMTLFPAWYSGDASMVGMKVAGPRVAGLDAGGGRRERVRAVHVVGLVGDEQVVRALIPVLEPSGTAYCGHSVVAVRV